MPGSDIWDNLERVDLEDQECEYCSYCGCNLTDGVTPNACTGECSDDAYIIDNYDVDGVSELHFRGDGKWTRSKQQPDS